MAHLAPGFLTDFNEPVIIVGAGLAGLMTALHLAPHPAIVLTKAPLGTGAASGWAQGGIAAALGPDDAPALHAADTLAAGDGLCDPQTVSRITSAAREAIEELARRGVAFDRDAAGALEFGLEAAHSRHRIVHAKGDGTGQEIMRALIEAARSAPSITLMEGVEARRLLTHDGAVVGLLAAGPQGPLTLASRHIVMASGGLGGLYRQTTNPRGAIGQGLALAARAGAALADMEFVQFHPTALDTGLDPMPLVSEAVRGEGAILIDETGDRFLAGQGRAELEPRDIVARAVFDHRAKGHRTFLDARRALGPRFEARFPSIAAKCRAAGIDPARQPIPVVPAAHYAQGGIAVDANGRSSLAGLWACGEAAATGLHGANRLASNSLLEAAVCARFVAESVIAAQTRVRVPALLPAMELPPAPDAGPVRQIMDEKVGVLRERSLLESAVAALAPLAKSNSPAADPAAVALIVAAAALMREESRGSHARRDFPAHDPAWGHRLTLRLHDAEAMARNILERQSAVAIGA